VHDVHCGSPFNFEKLCLKGGLDGLDFPFTIPRTIFGRLSDGAKKILVVQKALYITNGHIFRFCPKNFLGRRSEVCAFAPKCPFTIQRTE